MAYLASKPVPLKLHPVYKKKYIIPTRSIEVFLQKVEKCIRLRTPGAIIFSLPRYGKSHSIKYSRKYLAMEYPNLPVFVVSSHKKKISSESAFFSKLLTDVKHKHPESGTISAKRTRLNNFLVEKASKSDEDLVIFFIDEAQRFGIVEYEWLRDVHDELDLQGIRMMTFLVGQYELLNQKHALRESKQIQIVMRFMVDELQFRGIRTEEELAICLQGYDESTFPENSDWSYSRFFFPEAYANGFRIIQQTNNLWGEFEKVHAKASFSSKIEIPMQYVARTIELFMLENMEHDSAKFRGTKAMWKQAIKESRFIDAQEELRLIIEEEDYEPIE